MKTIISLAFEGLRYRKRESLLIFFVLLISFTFAIITLSYSSSISATNSAVRIDTYGSWYGAITSANPEDGEYLESASWLDSVGASVNYGKVSNNYIGTVDSALANMGIKLEEGQLPKNSGEIAIEASTLSFLGYNYTLGQEIELTISFTCGEETIIVTESYTLCGIIQNYTSLWGVSGGNLNSIILTEEDAENLLKSAQSKAEILGYEELPESTITYFFTVKSGYESVAESEVNQYLWDSRTGLQSKTAVINTAVTMNQAEEKTVLFYAWIILAITLIAVVMVYILQMQKDVRRIVRFRSIGASKRQMRLLISSETLILCIPALFLGVISGAVGIWALLKVSVYSGSASVSVNIPWKPLLIVSVAWIAGVLLARMLTFQIALSTPLTGRMGMQQRKSSFYVSFRKFLILLTAMALCLSGVFTAFNMAEPLYNYTYWSSRPSYMIGNGMTSTVSDEVITLLSEIPGINDIKGYSLLTALTSINGSDASYSNIYVLEYDDWSDIIDFSGADIDAYNNGEAVLLSYTSTTFTTGITVSDNGEILLSSYDDVEVVPPESGSSLTLTVDLVDSNEKTSTIEVDTVVSNTTLNEYTNELGLMITQSYNVICSRAFIQKILDMIPDGMSWNSYYGYTLYNSGDNAEFLYLNVYTSMNAEYLSTDKGVSNIATQYFLGLDNRRETNSSNAQVYLQSLIMLIISGVCIALVVLMILVSTLRLETESEKKRYGIMQAIGMSKRQRNFELARRAAVRSVVSTATAVVSYLCYYLAINIPTIVAGASPLEVLGTMFATLAGYGLTVPVLLGILAILFLITFAICFGSKLSINRYSIMDMLRDDR